MSGRTIRSATPPMPCRRSRRAKFDGLAKIASIGVKVSRHCSYHGAALNVAMDLRPFERHQPVRSCRAGRDRPFYNRRARLVGRGRRDPRRQARRLPGPPDDPDADLRPDRQAEGRSQDIAHPDQGRGRGDAEEARLDPRQGRLADHPLLRDQADPARAQAAHGLRGSLLPEHRRVLRQGHRDLHDHGRQVHPALPVLRRRPRPARPARRRRAAQPGQDDRRAQAQVRGDHQRRPRRPARRRRRPLRRLHREDARALARHADRDPDARLPRPHGPGAGDPEGGAAGRDEPQPRDRAPPLQGSASRLRLRVLAQPAASASRNSRRTCRPRAASWSASARPTRRSCR